MSGVLDRAVEEGRLRRHAVEVSQGLSGVAAILLASFPWPGAVEDAQSFFFNYLLRRTSENPYATDVVRAKLGIEGPLTVGAAREASNMHVRAAFAELTLLDLVEMGEFREGALVYTRWESTRRTQAGRRVAAELAVRGGTVRASQRDGWPV